MTTPRRSAPADSSRRIDPDRERLAAAVALLYLEVEAGRRPAEQIRGLVSPAVYERLRVRTRTRAVAPDRRRTGPARGAIRAVHTSVPAPDAFEASVVVTNQHRVSAIALRMEHHLGRWRVVEVSRPEDGEPPRRTASLAERPRRLDALDETTDEPAGTGPGVARPG